MPSSPYWEGVEVMAQNKKAELFCITLSTYKEYASRYTSNIESWESLYEQTIKIFKALRAWANTNQYLYIVELYIVLSKTDTGRYYPHIHGVIAVDSMEVIRRIAYYWKKEKLGSGEFKQDEKGNISKGNIHIQHADNNKSYGTRKEKQYGIEGFLKYSREQQDTILINNGVICRKSLRQDNIPNDIKRDYIFIGRGRYDWGKIYKLWEIQEDSDKMNLDRFFQRIHYQKYSDKTNTHTKSPINTRGEEQDRFENKTDSNMSKPPIMIGYNTNKESIIKEREFDKINLQAIEKIPNDDFIDQLLLNARVEQWKLMQEMMEIEEKKKYWIEENKKSLEKYYKETTFKFKATP